MSKAVDRKFKRMREAEHAYERQLEAERAEARLKGFKVASSADMANMVLGRPEEPSMATELPRHIRRRMGRKR